MNETTIPKLEKMNTTTQMNISPDLLFFKNDVLGDLKSVESKIAKKLYKQNEDTDKKLIQFENKLDSLTQKLFSLSNITSANTFAKEKMESLFQFRTKMEETMNNFDLKLKSISKDLVDSINRYDRIIENNIFYQGIIGSSNARFRTFHDFIDYVLANIGQLIIFRDRTIGIDFKQYKKNLDKMIEALKKQSDNILENNKIFTTRYVDNLEHKIKSDYELYEQKLFNLKIQNTEQCTDLEKLTGNLIKEWGRISEMRREINNTLNNHTENFKHHFLLTENKLNECIKEYNEMKRRFDLFVEFMKGVKSGVGSQMTFNEFLNFKENPEYHKKKTSAESYLKKYIVGEMGMDQITHLSKKFSRKLSTFNENNNHTINNLNTINIHKSSKFLRNNSINDFSYKNSNETIYSINNINNEQNKFEMIRPKSILTPSNINIKDGLIANNDEKKFNSDEKKKMYSFKRFNTSNFNNFNTIKKTDSDDKPKGEIQDKIFKNNVITLNRTFNITSAKNIININNQNNNLVNNNDINNLKFENDDKINKIESKSNLIQKNKNINFDKNSQVYEIKNNINNNIEEKKFKLKRKGKSSDDRNENEQIKENQEKIYIEKALINKENNKKNKGYINNKTLVENHINNINYFGEESKIKNEYINEKNKNNMFINGVNENVYESNIDRNNINLKNNYDINVILENNENEEKEEKDEEDNEKMEIYSYKEINLDKVDNSKKNNNYNNNPDSKNNLANNNSEIRNNPNIFKKVNTNDLPYAQQKISKEKKNLNNTINNNYIDHEQFYFNKDNKINLHKLLRGNKNAFNFFQKIIENGEVKMPNMTLTDKKNPNYIRKINLNSVKTPLRNNSCINFYQANNPINRVNYEYFEDLFKSNNTEENDIYNQENNFYSCDNRDKNINYNKTKVNKMNNTELRTIQNNSRQAINPKIHIVNLPGILEYKKIENNDKTNKKSDRGINEAFNQILELRKINYENDLYRKNKGPKLNVNNRNFKNNKFRSYNGIINSNYFKNGNSSNDDCI